jgi:hypothetical protein
LLLLLLLLALLLRRAVVCVRAPQKLKSESVRHSPTASFRASYQTSLDKVARS